MLSTISAIGVTLVSLVLVVVSFVVTLATQVWILSVQVFHAVAPYAMHLYHTIGKMFA
jgi:hypothetical protein